MVTQKLKDLEEVLEDAPEINIHNFDINDVEKLNDCMVRAYNLVLVMIKEALEETDA